MAPVVKALETEPTINSIVAVTAQHREMLDQVLELFEIRPDYDLNIMMPNQDLFDLTSKILLGIRDILIDSRPDLVLVHGDTTTCMTAGLAAFYMQIPIGHVEAGLRTGNMTAPFPEEANRSLVGRLASYHFAPTRTAKLNLIREGIPEEQIWVTGNTVIDALLAVRAKASKSDPNDWRPNLPNQCIKAIEEVKSKTQKMILITGHRRENFGQGFLNFCNALKNIAEEKPDWLLVYPVHLNPNVQKPVREILSGCANILLIGPQDYLPFVWLLDKCDLVITDSGGIQEEAPSLGKPVLVTRDVTERPEAVEAGTVRLVGTHRDKILSEAIGILSSDGDYREMSEAHNPYGDGKAAMKIISTILT